MTTSEQINELAAALAKAQGEFPPIPKDCTAKVTTKKGGEYTFKYADLETILRTIRPVLAANGLAISLSPELRSGEAGGLRAVVTTVLLMHSSGQWVKTEGLAVAIDPEAFARQPAQSIGSAATFSSRYGIEAALAIRATEDQDGAEASDNAIEVQRQPQPQKLEPTLAKLLAEFHWPDSHKREYADRLLASYSTDLAECVQKPEVAKAVAVAINAAMGIAPEDDDGNAATAAPARQQQPTPQPTRTAAPGTLDESLAKILREFGWPIGEQTARANAFLFHYSTNLEECRKKPEVCKATAFAIEGNLREFSGMPRLDALNALYRSITETAK